MTFAKLCSALSINADLDKRLETVAKAYPQKHFETNEVIERVIMSYRLQGIRPMPVPSIKRHLWKSKHWKRSGDARGPVGRPMYTWCPA